MIRKTLTTLSLVALLLSAVLWGVSYVHVVAYSRQGACALTAGTLFWSSRPEDGLISAFGARSYGVASFSQKDEVILDPHSHQPKSYVVTDRIDWTAAGFSNLKTRWTLRYFRNTRGMDPWCILCVPLWIPVLVFSVLPSYLFAALHRRRRRRKRGLCVGCGYDLRGSQGRCSECGEQCA